MSKFGRFMCITLPLLMMIFAYLFLLLCLLLELYFYAAFFVFITFVMFALYKNGLRLEEMLKEIQNS